MTETSVVNASPLIYLSRANLLDLLQIISTEIIVPQPVADEILQRGLNDVTAQAIQHNDWLKVVPPSAIPPEITSWSLGLGESSVWLWL